MAVNITTDLNVVTERVGIASQFLQNAYVNGEQAARSLDELSRNALFGAYLGGNTRVTTTLTSTSPTVSVDDVRGFQIVFVNGVQQPVSSSNPMTVTIGASVYSLVSVSVDATNVSTAPNGLSGTLTLSSGGAIGQTGAIHAAALNAATTAGAIMLTNSGNNFGTVTLSTSGTDDASVFDATNLVVASANIGGDLTLSVDGSLGQTGAIHAASLNATTTGGAIDLTNAGNSFAIATLATAGTDNASLYDAMDLTIAGATVGGMLTLSGGGAIGQSGAIHAASLVATTTHGAITLTNAGNTVATATLSTSGADDASFTDASNLIIASANVGGTLTLSGGGSIGQTGAIHAAGLDVFEQEPKVHPGLLTLDNVVLTPHIGSAEGHWRRRMTEMVRDNALALLAGVAPPNLVAAD